MRSAQMAPTFTKSERFYAKRRLPSFHQRGQLKAILHLVHSKMLELDYLRQELRSTVVSRPRYYAPSRFTPPADLRSTYPILSHLLSCGSTAQTSLMPLPESPIVSTHYLA